MIRYRVRWSRTGKVRYLSAHDTASVFERATRRAKLLVAYSQGYSPHPKIGFATALPVGYASTAELMDVALIERIAESDLVDRMNASLPDGFRIEGACELGGSAVKLGRIAAASDYVLHHDAPWLPDALSTFMSLDTYGFERSFKGSTRVDDLRGGVFSATSDGSRTEMRCALMPRGVRPTDVVEALARIAGRDAPHVQVERVRLLTEIDGELLPIDEQGVLEAVSP